MRLLRQMLIGPLVLTTALSTSAFGQTRHALDPAAMAEAVAQHAAAHDADRAAIHEALARPEVRGVAASAGINLDRLSAAVGTMNGADLERAAAAARNVNDALVGGATTLVISTTTIIIALLVIIIVLLAVD